MTGFRVLCGFVGLLVAVVTPAVTWVVDGDLAQGGDCAAIGTWDAAGRTCHVVDLELVQLDRLEIHAATLVVAGTLLSDGIVEIHGTLRITGRLESSNFVFNRDEGTIVNEGEFVSTILVYNNGSFRNEASGTIDMTFELSNNGTLVNHGAMQVDGSLINNDRFENHGAVVIVPTGELWSFGTVVTSEVLANAGSVQNNGDFVEICAGGVSGNPPTGAPATAVTELRLDASELVWCSTEAGTRYDVVRGDLQSLRSSGGDFISSTAECLANDVVVLELPLGGGPVPGEGEWFLVRSNGPDGTFDSGYGSQVDARDLEIDASGQACP